MPRLLRSHARDVYIIGLYRDGWSIKSIARDVEMSPSGVHRLLMRLGEPPRPRGRPTGLGVASQTKLDAIHRRLREGATVKTIAGEMGCSRQAIYALLKCEREQTEPLERTKQGRE